jgi:hypothetical protein
VFEAALNQQQQQQVPLQQQPTMPELWLSSLADVGAGEGGVERARQLDSGSCISFSGGTAGGLAPITAEGGHAHLQEDLGLSQLKQAFVQQLLVQHSNAGEDLL